MAKETYHKAKETYVYGKRDLRIWQKRPNYMTKETFRNFLMASGWFLSSASIGVSAITERPRCGCREGKMKKKEKRERKKE